MRRLLERGEGDPAGSKGKSPEEFSLQILLVDADARALAHARRLARAQGHAVTARESAKGLVEEVRQTRYHVVLLDQRLVEDDGLALFRRVREADSDLSVVLTAAKPELATAVAAMKLGAVDYVLKPMTATLLRDCLFDVAKAKGLFRDPDDELHARIGANVRRLRLLRELTLTQLARRTGLSISLLSQVERAMISPSLSSLHRLSSALGVRVQELLEGC